MRIEDHKILIGNTLEEVTPEIIAELFAGMKSDQQAAFFSKVGALVETWAAGCMALQLQYVTSDVGLTPAGRRVMQEIGEYAQNTGGIPESDPGVFWDNAKCEICGAQAAVQVFDLVEYEKAETGERKVRHHGNPHLFCDKHKRESRRIKVGPMWAPSP